MDAVGEFTTAFYQRTNQRLQERVEILEEENRQLKSALNGGEAALPDWFPHLTKLETTLFRTLIARRIVTREAAMLALYSDRPSPPMDKIIDVWIVKLRAKLSPMGIVIDTVWGQGWSLSTASRLLIEVDAGDGDD